MKTTPKIYDSHNIIEMVKILYVLYIQVICLLPVSKASIESKGTVLSRAHMTTVDIRTKVHAVDSGQTIISVAVTVTCYPSSLCTDFTRTLCFECISAHPLHWMTDPLPRKTVNV